MISWSCSLYVYTMISMITTLCVRMLLSHFYQCDQMSILPFQYLSINSKENLPNRPIEVYHIRHKILPSTKQTLKICQSFTKCCQSGEISPNVVTLFSTWNWTNASNIERCFNSIMGIPIPVALQRESKQKTIAPNIPTYSLTYVHR